MPTAFTDPCVFTGSTIDYDLDSTTLPFAKNSSDLGSEKDTALAEPVRLLNANPVDITITITGNTDGDGTADDNYVLGLARAQSVADYLRQHVNHSLNITVKSNGASVPKVSETGLSGVDLSIAQAQNRRVELHLEGVTAGCVSS